jgi:putative lipoprotein
MAKTMVYECSGIEFITRVGPGEMALWLEDRYLVLSQVRSASGTKYEEADVMFWSKGDEVLLEIDGLRYRDCRLNHARAPWEDARRRGVDFRALGNEPGWQLEIRNDEHLLFEAYYGSQRTLLRNPQLEEEPGLRRYRAGEGQQRIKVVVTEEFCTDTMKGEGFPFSVVVDFGGREYFGCGRELDYPWR